jgi:hypothetical protein
MVTMIARTKPMMTIPSVEPTSDSPSVVGDGVAICWENEAALKFCAADFALLKFTEASTKTSVMNTSVIPKICDVFIVLLWVLYHARKLRFNLDSPPSAHYHKIIWN